MDKLNSYRQLVRELLLERSKLRSPHDPIQSQKIFETEGDHYQLVNVGWKDNNTRIYGCILHVDIKGDKIWVQHDGTEEAIRATHRLCQRKSACRTRCTQAGYCVSLPRPSCPTIHRICCWIISQKLVECVKSRRLYFWINTLRTQ